MYKFFRGNRKSYYEEDFIIRNEKVDTHVIEIGHNSDVTKCSTCVLYTYRVFLHRFKQTVCVAN